MKTFHPCITSWALAIFFKAKDKNTEITKARPKDWEIRCPIKKSNFRNGNRRQKKLSIVTENNDHFHQLLSLRAFNAKLKQCAFFARIKCFSWFTDYYKPKFVEYFFFFTPPKSGWVSECIRFRHCNLYLICVCMIRWRWKMTTRNSHWKVPFLIWNKKRDGSGRATTAHAQCKSKWQIFE